MLPSVKTCVVSPLLSNPRPGLWNLTLLLYYDIIYGRHKTINYSLFQKKEKGN